MTKENITAYDSMIEFATVRQIEYVDALKKHGSQVKAAKAMGIAPRAIERGLARLRAQAALQMPNMHDYRKPLPTPFQFSGVSQLVNNRTNEVTQTWYKSKVDDVQRIAMLKAFIEDLCADVKGKAPVVKPPTFTNADLLACYPIGDHHHGMRSDAEETGKNYDCKISKHSLESAFDYLISIMPPAETALVINLGDFTHANDNKNETPGGGNKLDVDSRYGKVMYTGAFAVINSVLKLLAKHKKVILWMMPGNHDPEASFALAMAIKFYFHNEPRVEVDLGTSLYKYHRFGANLIASHHGHGAKFQDLPLIMARDRKEDWGQTDFRVWHCGHIHHKTAKEFPGCVVETHRTLAPSDSWHHGQGYRSEQDMNAILYHIKHGEIQRSRFDMRMLAI